MKELARALLSDETDTMTCELCNAQLAEYVTALVMESGAGDAFPKVRSHIAMCPACADNYKVLLRLTAQAYSAAQHTMSKAVSFDFSFLESKQERTFFINQLKHLIINLSSELLHPTAALTYATVGVRAEELTLQVNSSETAHRFSVEVQGKRLEATIRCEKRSEDNKFCTIVVEIDTPDRDDWLNWEGIEVRMLHRGDELAKGSTDIFGQAVFENLAVKELSDLSVDIALAQYL